MSICGQHIPKGTCIVPLISCVLYDETVYPKPFDFCPERFIDQATGELKGRKRGNGMVELIPFSVGRRECLGQKLATMELFLNLSNLFNVFEVGGWRGMRMEGVSMCK